MHFNHHSLLSFCRFQDKVQINFVDGPSRTIPVTAYGHGTTIVTDPPMSPVLNLGPHFSKGPCKRTFTLTNKGRRHQSLVWSTEGFGFKQLRGKKHGTLRPLSPKDMKYKVIDGAYCMLYRRQKTGTCMCVHVCVCVCVCVCTVD